MCRRCAPTCQPASPPAHARASSAPRPLRTPQLAAIGARPQSGQSELWDELLERAQENPAFLGSLLEHLADTPLDPVQVLNKVGARHRGHSRPIPAATTATADHYPRLPHSTPHPPPHQMPPGMAIDNLRRRLISVFRGQQHKVSLEQCCASILRSDTHSLLRTLVELRRRGVRVRVTAEVAAVAAQAAQERRARQRGVGPARRRTRRMVGVRLATGRIELDGGDTPGPAWSQHGEAPPPEEVARTGQAGQAAGQEPGTAPSMASTMRELQGMVGRGSR